jgi:hypothetical protein
VLNRTTIFEEKETKNFPISNNENLFQNIKQTFLRIEEENNLQNSASSQECLKQGKLLGNLSNIPTIYKELF